MAQPEEHQNSDPLADYASLAEYDQCDPLSPNSESETESYSEYQTPNSCEYSDSASNYGVTVPRLWVQVNQKHCKDGVTGPAGLIHMCSEARTTFTFQNASYFNALMVAGPPRLYGLDGQLMNVAVTEYAQDAQLNLTLPKIPGNMKQRIFLLVVPLLVDGISYPFPLLVRYTRNRDKRAKAPKLTVVETRSSWMEAMLALNWSEFWAEVIPRFGLDDPQDRLDFVREALWMFEAKRPSPNYFVWRGDQSWYQVPDMQDEYYAFYQYYLQ